MTTRNSTYGFSAVSHHEMQQVQGGALPLIGRIAVRVAAKAIIWGIDKVRGRK